MARLNEESLEKLIVTQMVDGGWREGDPSAFNASFALDLGEFAAFIAETQPQLTEPLGLDADSPRRHKFLQRLQGEITRRGIVHLLRNGLDHLGHHIDLYYPTPTPGNTSAAEVFAENRCDAPWVCWRLQSYGTRMEPWPNTRTRDAAIPLRRRLRRFGWCERSAPSSVRAKERRRGWLSSSVMVSSQCAPGCVKLTSMTA